MKPKILILDIETAPLTTYVWDLKYNDYIPHGMIKHDWFMMSWAAKFHGEKRVYQQDQRNSRVTSNDKNISKGIYTLMCKADIIVTQNGKKFDEPRLKERFLIHGFKPLKTYQHIDVCQLFKKHFKFPSNSLAYLSAKLCKKYEKLDHKKFPGFDLWKECLKGNKTAWREMAKYNIHDVLTLEELFDIVMPYANPINMSVYYRNPVDFKCHCGSTKLKKNGFIYTATGKFQRYDCTQCGYELKSNKNIIKTPFRKTR